MGLKGGAGQLVLADQPASYMGAEARDIGPVVRTPILIAVRRIGAPHGRREGLQPRQAGGAPGGGQGGGDGVGKKISLVHGRSM